MSRPKKREVDYFPHYCEHGKVLFIIENKWGNEGYAFFYKLCELLGKKEGHSYDCNESGSWEYLLAKTLLDGEKATDILNTLYELKVIDNTLWESKIIWMQSFVDSIIDVYARRKVDLPVKPVLTTTQIPTSGVIDDINPQSKVKESKVKNTIGVEIPEWISKETWDAFVEMRKVIKKPMTDRAMTLMVGKLEKLKYLGQNVTEVLNQSILNNWSDVYEVRGKDGNTGRYNQKDTRSFRDREIDAEAESINLKYERAKALKATAPNDAG